MRTLTATVTGDEVRISVVEDVRDLEVLLSWALRLGAVALDVETTGLDIFGQDRLRLVQFGNRSESFVLDVERFPAHLDTVATIIKAVPRLVLHNAAFDLLALDRVGVLELDTVWSRVIDTRVLAHLLDPRSAAEGGPGHGLKALAAYHLGDDADRYQAELHQRFRTLRLTRSSGWAGIETTDEAFLRYAAVDTVLTARLYYALGPLARLQQLDRLAAFESQVGLVCAKMQRTGLLLDVQYAEELRAYYESEETAGRQEAASFGIEKVNSPAQVAEVLTALGAPLTERTPSGAPKVDRAVLTAIASSHGPAAAPAAAVLRAKQANKFRTSYVEVTLARRDSADRVHPTINPLQARTARMSISDPPLQQLPSGDWRVRRMFVPRPGSRLISVDFSQVEMRVLAALSGDAAMTEAIVSGEDLHSTAARLMFGPDFTEKDRKLAKVAGFAKVYGGGAATIARQTGVTTDVAKAATERYDRAFPGIRRLARLLQERAEFSALDVETPTGRRLPLDRDRLYAAVNYLVQSTARDLLAYALVKMDEAGLSDHLLLPIHDEVLAEAPADEVEEVAKAISDAMTMDFMGIPITTDTEVARGSWGSLYGADR
jgi:DNA polymerase-1